MSARSRSTRWLALALMTFTVLTLLTGIGPSTRGGPATAAEIERLIKQLGSDDFFTRLSASAALEAVGEPALEHFRKAARDNPDAEVRSRAGRLADDIAEKVRLAAFPKLTFKASQIKFDSQARHNTTAAVGDFTVAGPKEALKPLPKGVLYVAFDPDKKQWYGLKGHSEVCTLDLDNNTAEAMVLGDGVPELSWPCGLAFDTKRQRLILVSLGGVGHMYEYSPKTRKWGLLAEMNNIDAAALTYDSKADCLYALHVSWRGGGPFLTRFDDKGKPGKEIKLPAEMFPKEFGRPHGAAALSAVEGFVVIVIDETVYVVNPETEKVQQTSKSK